MENVNRQKTAQEKTTPVDGQQYNQVRTLHRHEFVKSHWMDWIDMHSNG